MPQLSLQEKAINAALAVLIDNKEPDWRSVPETLLAPSGLPVANWAGAGRNTIEWAARRVLVDALLRRGLFADQPATPPAPSDSYLSAGAQLLCAWCGEPVSEETAVAGFDNSLYCSQVCEMTCREESRYACEKPAA